MSCLVYAAVFPDLMAKFSFICSEARPHVVGDCELSLDSFKMFDKLNICDDKMWGISSLSDELLPSLSGFCSTWLFIELFKSVSYYVYREF